MELTRLFLLAFAMLLIAIFLLGRWLYLRSMRIRNQLQMSYIFTNITHELLTPLSIISASVEKLRETQPTNHSEYDLMELNIQRSVRLLQQILETSKSQAGELKLLVSNDDVMQHIKETARSIVPLMESKGINFSIHCKPESMMGWIDTDKLDKIIFNLLSNAAKYTGSQGIVLLDVTTNRTYDHIQIRVSDNGPGIPKERQKNLFTRFYDGDYRRNRTMGTGLGLALTRDLVYLNRGSIHCESFEGQGTTFIVELPIKKNYFSMSQIDKSPQTHFHIPSQNISDLYTVAKPIHINEETTATDDENAYHILIAAFAASLLQCLVDARECSGQCLAVGKEVAVVVHEDGNLEDALQIGAQSHSATEGREVGQVAYHAALIVSGAGEGEADGHGLRVEHLFDGGEALHQSGQTALRVGGHGLQAHGFYNLLVAADGGENEVGAASIQGQHDFLVVSHNFRYY